MSRVGDRGLDHARSGQEPAADGRPGLRRAEEAGGDARLQAGAARHRRVDDDQEHAAHDRLQERRRADSRGAIRSCKDEYVIYTAHWDHLGIGPAVNGDTIYNGAKDNAVGTAGLLEIARAFTKLPAPPKRSILFLSVTAEEQGLLGSEYYSVHADLSAGAKTAANINMDGLNVHGRTQDLTLIGYGASELDDYARDAAGEQGRIIRPRSGTGEGFLLPLRSLQLRQAGRAGARSRRRRRVHRQAGRLRREGARTTTPSTTTTSRPTS